MGWQKYYPKVPEHLKESYQQKVDQLQDKAKQLTQSWRELETEIKRLKKENFQDRFQLAVLKQKRKLYRAEYTSIMNGLAVLFVGIQNGAPV